MEKLLNKERYDFIIGRLNFLTRYYLKGLQYNKVYLKLSNGDDINLSFPSNHIPHLLGVYTEKLKAASVVKNNTSAFDILNKMVNGYITDISIKNMHPGFNIASLFSDEIDRKLDSFLDIMKFRTDDIYCIIKYKADRTYTTGEATENSDYFIVRKHINPNTNEERYTVLGICKKEGTNEYVPVTTRLFNDYIELSKFLNERSKNQEITYVSVARIDNDYKNFHYKHYTELHEKKEYNKVLKDVACKFGAIPSTNAFGSYN
ncbi:MAG: hypothetical protein IJS56_04475 [Bacilli bacterium]|nr:hypothetical protein [Bacilli bacterium]